MFTLSAVPMSYKSFLLKEPEMIRTMLEARAWIQILIWLDEDAMLLGGLLQKELKLYSLNYFPK